MKRSAAILLAVLLGALGVSCARGPRRARETRHRSPSSMQPAPTPRADERTPATAPGAQATSATGAEPSGGASAEGAQSAGATGGPSSARRVEAVVASRNLAEHACGATSARRTVFASPAAPTVVGASAGFVIAAYVPAGTGETVVLLTTSADGRSTRLVGRWPVSPSVGATQLVPPGLARIDASHVALVTVDALRRLVYREVDLASGEASEATTIAEGSADTRFPPAIAMAGALRLVAYTRIGTLQRIEVVVLDATPRAIRRHDVTPDSAGAASPTFVADVSPPLLVFVDPREAFSLAHAVRFDPEGMPGEDDSLQPIVGLATPARLTAALGPRDLHLAFLAHGETNRMGSFVLDAHAASITPRALVPASDFVRLWVDAIGTSYGAITASLAPHDARAADRDVVVRLVDAAGVGPELRIEPVTGSAIYPTIARDDAGRFAVVFGTNGSVEIAPLECRGIAP